MKSISTAIRSLVLAVAVAAAVTVVVVAVGAESASAPANKHLHHRDHHSKHSQSSPSTSTSKSTSTSTSAGTSSSTDDAVSVYPDAGTFRCEYAFNPCSALPPSTVDVPVSPPLDDVVAACVASGNASVENAFEIRYLQAPLFEAKFGRITADFRLYHNAIGIRQVATGYEWTLSYNAVYEVFNATFPFIVYNSTAAQKELRWCNRATLCMTPWFNAAEFTQVTKIGALSCADLQRYIGWSAEEHARHPTYELWDVRQWRTNELYIGSYACYSFVWASMAFLHGPAMNMTFLVDPITLKHDFVNLFVNEPPVAVLVNGSSSPSSTFDDSAAVGAGAGAVGIGMNDIVAFYENFRGLNTRHVTIKAVIDWLTDVTSVHKFVFSNGTYYRVALHIPPISMHYDSDPLSNY